MLLHLQVKEKLLHNSDTQGLGPASRSVHSLPHSLGAVAKGQALEEPHPPCSMALGNK